MEHYLSEILVLIAQGLDSFAEATNQSPAMIMCSTPLLFLIGTRILFGKQALKLLFRIIFATVGGIVLYVILKGETPLAISISLIAPAAYLLLVEKRAPIVTVIFKEDGLLAFANLWGFLVGVFIGAISLFVLNWIGWRLPGDFLKELFAEFGGFLAPAACFGVGYMAGARYSLLSVKHHLKSLLWLTSILAATIVVTSYYYFDYREFQARAVAILAEEYDEPAALVDEYLFYETGYRQLPGYLILSARGAASLTIFEDDYEVPEGDLSVLINWGKRVLIYLGSVFFVRKGLINVWLERIKTGNVSGEGFWTFLEGLLDDDD